MINRPYDSLSRLSEFRNKIGMITFQRHFLLLEAVAYQKILAPGIKTRVCPGFSTEFLLADAQRKLGGRCRHVWALGSASRLLEFFFLKCDFQPYEGCPWRQKMYVLPKQWSEPSDSRTLPRTHVRVEFPQPITMTEIASTIFTPVYGTLVPPVPRELRL